MKRTSTIEHKFELDFDYEQYVDKFFLTYKQDNQKTLVFTERDIGDRVKIDGNSIIVNLSQNDTKMFSSGTVFIELKVYTKNKKVLINDGIIQTYMQEVLNDELFED